MGVQTGNIDVTKNIIGINNIAYKDAISTPNTFNNIKNCTEKTIYLANPNNKTFINSCFLYNENITVNFLYLSKKEILDAILVKISVLRNKNNNKLFTSIIINK